MWKVQICWCDGFWVRLNVYLALLKMCGWESHARRGKLFLFLKDVQNYHRKAREILDGHVRGDEICIFTLRLVYLFFRFFSIIYLSIGRYGPLSSRSKGRKYMSFFLFFFKLNYAIMNMLFLFFIHFKNFSFHLFLVLCPVSLIGRYTPSS